MDPIRHLLMTVYKLDDTNIEKLTDLASTLLEQQEQETVDKTIDGFTKEDWEEINAVLDHNIEPIKTVRTITGLSLSTAKKVVEQIKKAPTP